MLKASNAKPETCVSEQIEIKRRKCGTEELCSGTPLVLIESPFTPCNFL